MLLFLKKNKKVGLFIVGLPAFIQRQRKGPKRWKQAFDHFNKAKQPKRWEQAFDKKSFFVAVSSFKKTTPKKKRWKPKSFFLKMEASTGKKSCLWVWLKKNNTKEKKPLET